MSTINKLGIITLSALALVSISNSIYAQHNDVEFGYEAGKIDIEFGSEGRVFEGNFSDLVGGPDETHAPGYGSEIAEGLGIDADDIIGYNVVGPLLYHDGAGFAPTTSTLVVESIVGSDVSVDSSTTSGSGIIGQADSAGEFHAHVDYAINSGAPTGAYGLLLTLSAFDSGLAPKSGIADSDSFYIIFNRGLSEATFEGAVGEFAALVPEPASIGLASIAALMACCRRRRLS